MTINRLGNQISRTVNGWLVIGVAFVLVSVAATGASANAFSGDIFTVAGGTTFGDVNDGRPALDARMTPSSVAGLPDGGFLVVERGNHRVRRVAPNGVISGGDGGNFIVFGAFSVDGNTFTLHGYNNELSIPACGGTRTNQFVMVGVKL